MLENKTIFILGAILLLGGVIYYYRDDISNYFSFKEKKNEIDAIKNKKFQMDDKYNGL